MWDLLLPMTESTFRQLRELCDGLDMSDLLKQDPTDSEGRVDLREDSRGLVPILRENRRVVRDGHQRGR